MGGKSSKAAGSKSDRKRQAKVVKLLEGEGLGIDDYASDGDSSESSNSTNLESEIDHHEGEGEEGEEGFYKVREAFKTKDLGGNIYEKIQKLRNKGDLAGAKALAREWLKDNPHDLHARIAYGRLLWIQGQWRHAEQEFQHALGKHPKNVSVLRMYATFLASVRKDYKLASMLVSKAIDVEPQSRPLALLAAQIATRGGMVHDVAEITQEIEEEDLPAIKWQRHLPKKEMHMPTEIKQSVKSGHLRRQLYESTFLQEKEKEQEHQHTELDQRVGALASILPPAAVRGKVEHIFCDLEEAIPDQPPTRAMKSRNQLWPESWYSTDTVPSDATVATQKRLTKEDKDALEQAQRFTKFFMGHETKDSDFKQRRGSMTKFMARGGGGKLQP